jgi:hypothetical protein
MIIGKKQKRTANFDYFSVAYWMHVIDSPLVFNVKEDKHYYKFETKEGWWTYYPKANVLMKDGGNFKVEKGCTHILNMLDLRKVI